MNLIQEAESLILNQFAKSQKLKGLILGLVKPFQDALDSIESLHYGRYVDQANGETLDIIGQLVGQPRNGLDDENYRPWIKVRIHLNNCSGTPDSVLTILAILFDSTTTNVRMEELPPKSVRFTFLQPPRYPIKPIKEIIRSAMPLNTEAEFVQAYRSPTPALHSRKRLLNSPQNNQPFTFDVTSFSDSFLADFFQEEDFT
jgi:hypothetical protein